MSSLIKTVQRLVENEFEVQSDAQSAVSADSMAVAAKNTLTHSHIRDHLKAADEAEEEVETQTFGIETDTGEIIKVYVAVADADEFEKALGKKLGEEDDIEDVLDELADKYDIVDVKWPEEEAADDVDFGADKEEIQYDISQDDDAKAGNEDAAEDKLDTAIDVTPNGEADAPADVKSEKKGGLMKQAKDDDADANPDEEPEEEPTDDTPKKGGLKKKDDDEEEPEEEEKPKDDKPKKGGLKKKETKESFENSLLSSMIQESSHDMEFADHDIARLYHGTSNRQQRLIIELLAALGVPGDALLQKQSTFKTALKSAANDVMENSHLRIWLKKFVDATKHFIEPVEEDIKDEIHDQISSKLGVLAFEVARKLGLSEKIIQAKSYSIKKGLKAAVRKLAKNPKAKIALLMIASALGVSSGTSHSDLVTKEEDEHLANVTNDELVEDDVQPQAQAKQYLGTTNFAQHVQSVLTGLGVPVGNLQYQNAALQQSINKRMQSIKGMSAVMTKINELLELLNQSDTMEDVDPDDISQAALITGRHKVVEADDAPADLGEWAIGNVGDKITMKAGEFHVELEDDMEGNLEKIASAIGDGNVCSAKSGSKRITFRPTNRGQDYVVKVFGNTEFPNGVLLGSKSIDTLLDTIGEYAGA